MWARHAELRLPYVRCDALTHIRIERKLPTLAQPLVQVGDKVAASQVIACVPGEQGRRLHVVDLAGLLDLPNRDLSVVMAKQCGDIVEAGETIATRTGALPFLRRSCRSPVSGQLLAIAHSWVVIETRGGLLDILAFVSGQVTAMAAGHTITIETTGARVEGACGLGGEASGILRVVTDEPVGDSGLECVAEESKRVVLMTRGSVTRELLECANGVGIVGIIAGSIPSSLADMSALPVVATEGYGRQPMAYDRYDLLKRLEGCEVSISGQSGWAWRHQRPVIIVPLSDAEPGEAAALAEDNLTRPAQEGDRIRSVRSPYAGRVGKIIALVDKTDRTPSGFMLQGARVLFEEDAPTAPADRPQTGTGQWVPWLNLERTG
jgi:hypothetical protein